MEKMYESRQTLFNDTVPNFEDLSPQEKLALRGLLVLSGFESNEEVLKTASKGLSKDKESSDPTPPKETDAQQTVVQDWITSKKCKKTKKH